MDAFLQIFSLNTSNSLQIVSFVLWRHVVRWNFANDSELRTPSIFRLPLVGCLIDLLFDSEEWECPFPRNVYKLLPDYIPKDTNLYRFSYENIKYNKKIYLLDSFTLKVKAADFSKTLLTTNHTTLSAGI
jgi:hypothetical protein